MSDAALVVLLLFQPISAPGFSGERLGAARLDPERLILEGLKRFKAADYRVAVDFFRAAIIESENHVRATAYFALALVITNDGKNADKALRTAVELGFAEKFDLAALFKDNKEAARIRGLLGGVSGEGLLTAAWAEHLGGTSDRLKRLAEKDSTARRLLGI